MPLRRLIIRLMLCAAFVLASSYVQAMSHVDDIRSSAVSQIAKVKLPPCHQKMDGSDKKGHHHGCCSDFACALGLIVDATPTVLIKTSAVHAVDYGSSTRSGIQQPINPPPKTT